MLEKYSLFFWIDKYISVRYNEQRKPISEGALSEVRKVAARLVQSLPADRFSVTYINDNIRTFDNFKGSYARKFLDRINLSNGTDFQPTF